MRIAFLLALVLTGLAAGCQLQEDAEAPGAPAPAPPATPVADTLSAATTERVKAQVGVAKQGRSLDNETGVGGIIVEPARQLFAFKEKAVFEIQIPQALQLYRATEGRLPRTHEEFMTKIVSANGIRLPELPEGQKYVYDAETGELMVERPAR